jgi:hypothetical protein
MTEKQIIDWLLQGDISIQYQTYRDLLRKERKDLKNRIETEGWGQKFLSFRNDNGHWGRSFYQPKWTSTHYTLLDLKNLGIANSCKAIRESIELILHENKVDDGGIHPIGTTRISDVCINGMALNYCSYFKAREKDLESVIDFILLQQMPDGGFNCRSNRSGAKHSSLHTTLSVLEGILEYRKNNYSYRKEELIKAERESQKFILQHCLFKSDKTGKIIDNRYLKLVYPTRWRYDILRSLDYFQSTSHDYDSRMKDALSVLVKKKTKDGIWNLQSNHPGNFHFHMEEVGKPSRWNTLRVLRVLKHFQVNN